MRVTVFFVLLGVIQVSGEVGYAQEARLSIKRTNARLADVLNEIEDQSDFYFLYNQDLIDVDRRVNLQVDNEKIGAILLRLFDQTEVKYFVRDRQIILTNLNEKAVFSQQRDVSGTVRGPDGAVIPGVTVVLKGTSVGTITDTAGKFSMKELPPDATLVFSFVGMRTFEVPVSGRTNIDVVLQDETIGLEEVVAVGYGTQKKANLTGAVSMATAERLENRPIASVGHGLQGVIPNLNIRYDHGSPTASADFNIRGFESINGGSPLILVDGVPMDLERVNPNDIASVNVLKDAAAAAVYGARAAFGVILVETKKGKVGKVNVTLSTEQSLAKPIYTIDPVTDPYQFVQAWNSATMRTDGTNAYDEDYVNGTKAWSENPTEQNAWKVLDGELRYYGFNDYHNKLITDVAPQQKYDMTISGATEKTSYYVSFGHLSKDGYLNNSSRNEKYKRYNVLMKADFKVTDWLTLDEKIIFNSQFSDKPIFITGTSISTLRHV